MSCRSTAGGHVSTSLARMVTGLSDGEVQHIYHALKREGGHLPKPTEQEMKAWESRQQDMLDRAKRMSDKRRDALRDKLFRARSEDLDGGTFYAMSRVEARARQEVAVRSVEDAIDLAPAGSQRHLYELDAHGLPAKVWYASYGSNLHRDRFLVYVKGGRPEGSNRWYRGCRDTEIPDEDIAIRVPGARPHFALTSRVWNGGIAFIDTAKGETATGLGRAYKVTREQFEDVVAQENGAQAGRCAPIPYAEVFDTGRVVTGQGPYETLLHIGDHDGAPVLTFTSPFSTRDALGRRGDVDRTPVGEDKPVRMPVMTNKPSPAYLRMIGSGLAETFGMDEVAQADYLRGCPGGDRWTRREIVEILRTPNPPRPATTYSGSYGGSYSYGGTAGGTAGGWSGGGSWSHGGGSGDAQVGTLAPGSALPSSGGADGGGRGGSRRKVTPLAKITPLGGPLPTESGVPTPEPSKRGAFPGVATYASGEERDIGLRNWNEQLKYKKERLARIESNLRWLAQSVEYGAPVDDRRVESTRSDYSSTLAEVEELTVKVAHAKAQEPTAWFRSQPAHQGTWRWTIRDLTADIEKHAAKAQAAETSIQTTNPANTRELRNARARLTRATKEITKLTARREEAIARMASDAEVLPEPDWERRAREYREQYDAERAREVSADS
jgi:hypothetical protein